MHSKVISIPRPIQILLFITAFQCLIWSAYLVLLKPIFHDLYAEAVIRSLVRVSIVGIPALLYIFLYKKQNLQDYFNSKNFPAALRWGLVGCLVILFFFLPKLYIFQFPADFPAWMNWIIGSPVTEELYFRAIVLKELSKYYSTTFSMLLSSLLFLAFHMPQWIFTQDIGEFIVPAIMIFVYGVGFSFLWVKTKSIFAALLPHSLNNFLYMATVTIR